jgi:hypothetical protein
MATFDDALDQLLTDLANGGGVTRYRDGNKEVQRDYDRVLNALVKLQSLRDTSNSSMCELGRILPPE